MRLGPRRVILGAAATIWLGLSSLAVAWGQATYADYRDVSGVKMPFRWVVTWTDGRSTFELSELRANVPLDAAEFAKPAPAATKALSQ